MIKFNDYELDDLKIAGTKLDRRRKLSDREVREVISLFNNKENNKYTNKEISNLYNISVKQIYRYLDYDKALSKNREYNKLYYKNHKEEIAKKRKENQLSTKLYKSALLDLVAVYKS